MRLRRRDPMVAALDHLPGAQAMGLDTALRKVRTGRFQASLAAPTAEIYLEHDSASFGNKTMWWPIFVLPTAVPAGLAAAVSPRAAATILPLSSAIIVANGLQGTYLHARGVAQKPGGWRNARYNMEMGPPVMAPLLASLVGGMGLLASVLRREDDPR